MKTRLPPHRFRSPLLQPAPSIRSWGRLGVVSLRLIWVSSSVAILVTLITMIRLQLLPLTSFALLYWIHDFVYLGIKGYSFSLFFPWSLVWWLFLASAVLLMVASFLMDRSFLLGPHRAILKYLAHQRKAYPFLYRVTRSLNRWSISSFLLRRTLMHEREELVLRLFSVKQNIEQGQMSLEIAALTRLILQLELLFKKPDILFLAELWEETLLIIKFQPEPKQTDERMQHALRELQLALSNLLNNQTIHERNIRDMGSLFDQNTLLHDLARLAQVVWPDVDLFPGIVPEADGEILVGRSCEQRRRLIESAVRTQNRQTLNALKKSPAGWNLSLYLAFHYALVSGDLEQGVAYYDAVDTLVFMLATLPEDKNSLTSMESLKMPLIFPNSVQSQMVAKLQRSRFSDSSPLLKMITTLVSFDESPLKVNDLDLAKARLAEQDYWQAAGPIVGQEETFETRGKL